MSLSPADHYWANVLCRLYYGRPCVASCSQEHTCLSQPISPGPTWPSLFAGTLIQTMLAGCDIGDAEAPHCMLAILWAAMVTPHPRPSPPPPLSFPLSPSLPPFREEDAYIPSITTCWQVKCLVVHFRLLLAETYVLEYSMCPALGDTEQEKDICLSRAPEGC